MADLSIIIPARNEMFLAKTIENILENIEGDTEVIAVCDGNWPDPRIPDHPKVTLIHYTQSIGQRAATNRAVSLSKSKYIMKCDAHCAFDKGFDAKMVAEMHDDWTMVPLMKNLHAFDWVCPDGHRRYQSPSGPCEETLPNGQACGKETKRDILWQPKPSPNSVSYCFDSTPHFQYFGEFAKRPEGQGEIAPTMSLQGSCWMLTRRKYWELNICDEKFGSWGSQGIEVAVKTWLSGGAVMVNKKTWYAHMFRTQGGDFGFPYPIHYSDQEKAKTYARNLFFDNNWPKQIHPLSWLIEKFWPVKGWTDEDLKKLKANVFRFPEKSLEAKPEEAEPTESSKENLPKGLVFEAKKPSKGIVYYTDNALKLKIAYQAQKQLEKISLGNAIPVTSSSIKNMSFGQTSVTLSAPPEDSVTTFKLILNGLKNRDAEIIFLCANNVLYHESHFDFTPARKDVIYYNQSLLRLRATDGVYTRESGLNLVSLCGYRDQLIKYFEALLSKTKDKTKIGFLHWESKYPNIDIINEHIDKKYDWSKVSSENEIPGWGDKEDLVKKLN